MRLLEVLLEVVLRSRITMLQQTQTMWIERQRIPQRFWLPPNGTRIPQKTWPNAIQHFGPKAMQYADVLSYLESQGSVEARDALPILLRRAARIPARIPPATRDSITAGGQLGPVCLYPTARWILDPASVLVLQPLLHIWLTKHLRTPEEHYLATWCDDVPHPFDADNEAAWWRITDSLIGLVVRKPSANAALLRLIPGSTPTIRRGALITQKLKARVSAFAYK